MVIFHSYVSLPEGNVDEMQPRAQSSTDGFYTNGVRWPVTVSKTWRNPWANIYMVQNGSSNPPY